jgi:hypothetical protein
MTTSAIMPKRLISLAVTVLCSASIPPSLAQNKQASPGVAALNIETHTKPGQYDYTAEVYTERGQINGCGISFHVAWSTDNKDVSGVSASATFFIFPRTDRVEFAQAIKATAISNGVRKPITYAWVQTQQYGRTADFTRGPAEDPMSFIGWKRNDDNAVFIPLDMRCMGSFWA